ncbi:MAG TPA: hypothetical protein DHW82_01570 [Spirochaetia bacterium]|nr:MAG: hypothetical protein A2Y41_01810 [Spirochaetes bacterium GWB1_36_13]HCL55685.1 hypothetical protein [Spirochaetia bacterium]
MKNLKIQIILASLLALIGIVSFAAERPSAKPFSTRFMALGDAGVAVANDTYLLYQNPAGLGINKEGVAEGNGIFTILSVGARTDVKLALDVIDAIDAVSKDPAMDANDPLQAIYNQKDKVNKIIGKNLGIGLTGPIYLGYVGDGWGFMLSDAVDLSATVTRHAIPRVIVNGNAVVEFKFGLAFNFDLFDKNDLSIGIAPKVFERGDANLDKGLTEVESLQDDIGDSIGFGTGFGLDAGILLKIPFMKESRFGFAIDNLYSIYDKKSVNTNGDTTDLGTKKIKPVAKFGFYFEFSDLTRDLIGDWLGLKVMADINHLFDNEYPGLGKKLHFGAEFSLFSFLYFRAGINQGYMTGGLGLDLFILRVDYAYYQREVGPYAGNKVESTHAASISIAF